MKVCFDGLSLSSLYGTGLYTYTFEMLNNLFDIYPQPNYSIIWDKSPCVETWKNKKHLSYINLELNRMNNDFTKLEKYIIEDKINIYHSTNNGFSIPNKKCCTTVMSIHTLLPMHKDSFVNEKYLNRFHRVLPHALEQSDYIIAVSNFIKNELIHFFNVPPKKIHVIHPGVSKIFRPIAKDLCSDFLKTHYKINDNFLLYAGSIHPRKNIEMLLYIVEEISRHIGPTKLVIVGKIGGKRKKYYNQLQSFVHNLNLENQVIFTGTVKYEHMPYFYNGSDCVINLSDYEGFPLTTLEAIACNKPVVCSNNSSFLEILKKDHGILIDPKNKNSAIDKILEVVTNESYTKLILEKQNKILSNYQWHDSIQKLIRIYES